MEFSLALEARDRRFKSAFPDSMDKKAYHREWHAKQSAEYKAHKYELQKKRRQELREWFDDYKKTLKCSQCPEDHIACLDFHHLDPSKKEMSLSNLLTNGWSKERIMEEVDKCIVLCSNCHRKLHYAL